MTNHHLKKKLDNLYKWIDAMEEYSHSTMACPNCDGTGLETIEIFKPQSPDRDVGEPYEELRHCETCDGSGEIDE
jgi:DnaJ-class molecular chaperone